MEILKCRYCGAPYAYRENLELHERTCPKRAGYSGVHPSHLPAPSRVQAQIFPRERGPPEYERLRKKAEKAWDTLSHLSTKLTHSELKGPLRELNRIIDELDLGIEIREVGFWIPPRAVGVRYLETELDIAKALSEGKFSEDQMRRLTEELEELSEKMRRLIEQD